MSDPQQTSLRKRARQDVFWLRQAGWKDRLLFFAGFSTPLLITAVCIWLVIDI